MSRSRKKRKKLARMKAEREAVEQPANTWVDNSAQPKVGTDFGLYIPERIWRKVMHWINKSTNEVSGFGNLQFDEKTGAFVVTDAFLLDQEVGPGSTEIDPNALGKAIYQFRNVPNALKWHWHSHPTFGVFWSGTDMNLIRELGQAGWIVASVINQKEEVRTAFLQTVEVMGRAHDIFVDDIRTKVMTQMDPKLAMELDAEFKEKVREKKWTTGKWGTHSPGVTVYKGGARKTFREADDYMSEYEENRFSSEGGDDLPFLPSRVTTSSKPKGRTILDSEYTEWGYVTIDGKEYYNPCKDKDITTPELTDIMIHDMTTDEIEFMQDCCPMFKNAVRDYMTRQAKTKSEADWQEGHLG